MHENSERITLSVVWREVLALLSLEKGALRTTRDVCLQPGDTITGYLQGERQHLTHPLRYLIFSAAFFAGTMILAVSLGPDDHGALPDLSDTSGVVSPVRAKLNEADKVLAEAEEVAEKSKGVARRRFDAALARQARKVVQTTVPQRSMEIALTWTNVMLVVAMPVYAFLTWIAFRKASLNFAEHIVVNCYILGFQNVLAVGMIVPGVFFGQVLFSIVYMVVGLAYQTWAWRRVFQLSGWKQYFLLAAVTVAAIVSYLLVQGITTAFLLWFDVEFG